MHRSATQTREYPDQSSVLAALSRELSNEPLTKALTQSVRILRVRILRLGGNLSRARKRSEHVRISIGQGICGSAAKEGATIVVPDVSKDPRYLMCFPATRSEIVVPIKGKKGVLGKIDIDSSRLTAFNQEDREILEVAASLLARRIESQDKMFHEPSAL
jgi:GAF domain-containing protein